MPEKIIEIGTESGTDLSVLTVTVAATTITVSASVFTFQGQSLSLDSDAVFAPTLPYAADTHVFLHLVQVIGSGLITVLVEELEVGDPPFPFLDGVYLQLSPLCDVYVPSGATDLTTCQAHRVILRPTPAS